MNKEHLRALLNNIQEWPDLAQYVHAVLGADVPANWLLITPTAETGHKLHTLLSHCGVPLPLILPEWTTVHSLAGLRVKHVLIHPRVELTPELRYNLICVKYE